MGEELNVNRLRASGTGVPLFLLARRLRGRLATRWDEKRYQMKRSDQTGFAKMALSAKAGWVNWRSDKGCRFSRAYAFRRLARC